MLRPRLDRPLLSHTDLDGDESDRLLALTLEVATDPDRFRGVLAGRTVGLVFTAPSTRTRTAFWRAATDLGAPTISYGPADLQLTTGETWADTGAVLSEYLDAVVVRTNGPLAEMRTLARFLPATINALSKEEHPTQALADYCALHEHFGAVTGLTLAYCGEGNNTAAALALLMSRIRGTRCDFYCPPGYGLPADVVAAAVDNSRRCGAGFRTFAAIPEDPDPVDAVYTTRWQSMGTPHGAADWRAKFEPFRVTRRMFDRFATPDRTVFLHDLPAVRDEEVAAEVLDGEHAIVRRQAHHKRTAATAALLWCLGWREPTTPE